MGCTINIDITVILIFTKIEGIEILGLILKAYQW